MNQRISRTQIVSIYKIEMSFFDELADAGLLQVEREQEESFLPSEHLGDLERFMNLHYDLDINVPGIEVIERLLRQMKALRMENLRLQQTDSDIDNFEEWQSDF